MQQNSYPDQLRYQSIRPRGWYSRFKEWPVEPLSSNTYWNPNEIIRFLLLLRNGVMDPYRSHIRMQVSIPSTTLVGGLQVDNSAQSFISQMVISSNNVQRQRITDYDTLAAFLTDIGFSEVVCQNRQWQGLGYTSYQTGFTTAKDSRQHFSGMSSQGATGGLSTNEYGRSYLPTTVPTGGYGITPGTVDSQAITSGMSSQFLTLSNYLFHQPSTTTLDTTSLTNNGFLRNLRAQYNPSIALRDYQDSTSSYLTVFPLLSPGTLSSAAIRGFKNLSLPYNIGYSPNMQASYRTANNVITNKTIPAIADLWGFDRPLSGKFATGCGQPMISNTIPQCQFGYGVTSAYPVPVPLRVFSFPLMSTICGTLIPPDQFCLLPLAALNNLLIQLTLSPWAMFTTGYTDQHEYDSQGMSTQQQRNYQFQQIYYNLHIYEFPDEEIQRYIQSAIVKEIAITGSSWMLSAQYQIATGANLRGNWQINVASQYLAEVVFMFLSNQYMKYSFCRKQFRLSNNIRSMQLKFNTDFYPAQPIVGNAGCPVQIDQSGDNSEFLQYLLMTYNYRFSTNTPQPRINSFNFAINARNYDPTQTTSFYNPNTLFTNTASLNGSTVNLDTALGMPFFHQNRFVGRAAFPYSFQAHGHSRRYMIGVDSRQARPFQVNFDTWATNSFPSDQTMYAFTRSNVIITYGPQGVNVLGR